MGTQWGKEGTCVRDRELVPPPHVLEHVDHVDHAFQEQATGMGVGVGVGEGDTGLESAAVGAECGGRTAELRVAVLALREVRTRSAGPSCRRHHRARAPSKKRGSA